MNKGYANNLGFTLVEILVSMAILMMIMLIGSVSYSLIAAQWNKQTGNSNSQIERIHHLTLIDQVLAGVIPLALFDDREGNGFYFLGKQNEITAISLNGVFNKDSAVVFSLSLVTVDDGKMNLLYREGLIPDNHILHFRQSLHFTDEMQMLPNITDIDFRYFGWQSADDKAEKAFDSVNNRSKKAWFGQYMGHETSLHPEKLEMTLGFADGQITLYSDYATNSELNLSRFEGN